jgi:hypothetical protein
MMAKGQVTGELSEQAGRGVAYPWRTIGEETVGQQGDIRQLGVHAQYQEPVHEFLVVRYAVDEEAMQLGKQGRERLLLQCGM